MANRASQDLQTLLRVWDVPIASPHDCVGVQHACTGANPPLFQIFFFLTPDAEVSQNSESCAHLTPRDYSARRWSRTTSEVDGASPSNREHICAPTRSSCCCARQQRRPHQVPELFGLISCSTVRLGLFHEVEEAQRFARPPAADFACQDNQPCSTVRLRQLWIGAFFSSSGLHHGCTAHWRLAAPFLDSGETSVVSTASWAL